MKKVFLNLNQPVGSTFEPDDIGLDDRLWFCFDCGQGGRTLTWRGLRHSLPEVNGGYSVAEIRVLGSGIQMLCAPWLLFHSLDGRTVKAPNILNFEVNFSEQYIK